MSTMIASHFFCFGNEADGGHHCVWERGQTEEFENCPEQRISAKFPSGAKCWKNLAAAKMFQSWQSAPAAAAAVRSGVQGLRCACCIELLCSAVHPPTVLQDSVLHCTASKGGAAAFYNWLRSGWNRRVTSSLHTLLLLEGLWRKSQHTQW